MVSYDYNWWNKCLHKKKRKKVSNHSKYLLHKPLIVCVVHRWAESVCVYCHVVLSWEPGVCCCWCAGVRVWIFGVAAELAVCVLGCCWCWFCSSTSNSIDELRILVLSLACVSGWAIFCGCVLAMLVSAAVSLRYYRCCSINIYSSVVLRIVNARWFGPLTNLTLTKPSIVNSCATFFSFLILCANLNKDAFLFIRFPPKIMLIPLFRPNVSGSTGILLKKRE